MLIGKNVFETLRDEQKNSRLQRHSRSARQSKHHLKFSDDRGV
jgi:hypothetical protein